MKSSLSFGGRTAAAGTAYVGLLYPKLQAFTRLTKFVYRCGATAHTLSFMKALGVTAGTVARVATDTTVTLAADPGTGTLSGALAVSDYLCIELDDGRYFAPRITGLAGLVATIAALPAAVSVGRPIWTFGAPGDQIFSTSTQEMTSGMTIPSGGQSQNCGFQATTTASVDNAYEDPAGGLFCSNNVYEPLLIHSTNLTNAGTMLYVSGVHTTNAA